MRTRRDHFGERIPALHGRAGLESLAEQGLRSMAYPKKSALTEIDLRAVTLVRTVSQILWQHKKLYSMGQGPATPSSLFATREVL